MYASGMFRPIFSDILHENYPHFAATSRFNAYQALSLYRILRKKSSLLPFFSKEYQEKFAHFEIYFLYILHKHVFGYILFTCVRYNKVIKT